MRLNNEHAYDQKIYDIEVIKEHLVPEQRFRMLILRLAEKQGNIMGAYWLIDFISVLYPAEFPDDRKTALKKLTLKVYTAYERVPPKKTIVALMKASGQTVKQISEKLQVSRNTVYYFLDKADSLPTHCMLTYGEYNLMMDFMDAWHEVCVMDII